MTGEKSSFPLWNIFNRTLVQPFLEVFAPSYCFACGQRVNPNQVICSRCYEQLQWIEKPFCPRCGIPIQSGQSCSCSQEEHSCDKMFSALVFEHRVSQQLVHALKYQEYFALSKFLAHLLAVHCSTYNILQNIDWVTFVPLHSARKRERGYNQAELLAAAFAREMKLPFAKLLTRVRNTQSQTKLNRAERKQNVANVFSLTKHQNVQEKHIAILDDVITSGATIESCAHILKENGARSVLALSPLRAI